MKIEIYGLSDDEIHVHVNGQLRHEVTMFSGARYVGALDVRSIENASGDTRALRVHAIYDEGWSFAAGRIGEFCPIPDGWSVRVEPDHADRPNLVIDTGDELVEVTHRGGHALDADHPSGDEDVAAASSGSSAPLDLAAAQNVADHLAAHAPWLNAHVTLRRAIDEVRRLRALVNTPRTDEFFAAVQLEAAHQVERGGAAHDAGKTDPDWFWLVGSLAGQALRDDSKRLHHIVTTAAAALNWWRHATGVSTAMQPGERRAGNEDTMSNDQRTGLPPLREMIDLSEEQLTAVARQAADDEDAWCASRPAWLAHEDDPPEPPPAARAARGQQQR